MSLCQSAAAEAAQDHPHRRLAGSVYRQEPRGTPARHPQRGCPTQRPTRSPQPPPGLTGPEEPASAVLAVESQPAQSPATSGKGGKPGQGETKSRRAEKVDSRASELERKGIDYLSEECSPGPPPFRPPPGLPPPPAVAPPPSQPPSQPPPGASARISATTAAFLSCCQRDRGGR